MKSTNFCQLQISLSSPPDLDLLLEHGQVLIIIIIAIICFDYLIGSVLRCSKELKNESKKSYDFGIFSFLFLCILHIAVNGSCVVVTGEVVHLSQG